MKRLQWALDRLLCQFRGRGAEVELQHLQQQRTFYDIPVRPESCILFLRDHKSAVILVLEREVASLIGFSQTSCSLAMISHTTATVHFTHGYCACN